MKCWGRNEQKFESLIVIKLEVQPERDDISFLMWVLEKGKEKRLVWKKL